MEVNRLEVDQYGDLRAVRPEPRRRLLPRRRKSPRYWTDDEIHELVRVCYLGHASGMATAGVVLHVPARMVPRRVVRYQRKHHGSWFDYQWWGFAWDSQMWTNVMMGDDPIDLVQAFNPHAFEAGAREEARAWAGEVRDVPYFDLPTPARSTLLYAIRRGPGFFF